MSVLAATFSTIALSEQLAWATTALAVRAPMHTAEMMTAAITSFAVPILRDRPRRPSPDPAPRCDTGASL
jgi:hypothetical protein